MLQTACPQKTQDDWLAEKVEFLYQAVRALAGDRLVDPVSPRLMIVIGQSDGRTMDCIVRSDGEMKVSDYLSDGEQVVSLGIRVEHDLLTDQPITYATLADWHYRIWGECQRSALIIGLGSEPKSIRIRSHREDANAFTEVQWDPKWGVLITLGFETPI